MWYAGSRWGEEKKKKKRERVPFKHTRAYLLPENFIYTTQPTLPALVRGVCAEFKRRS